MDQKRLQDLLERIEKYPANVLDRFVLAKMYHENGLWSETIATCKEILKLKPDYLVVQIMLGESLFKTGHYPAARDTLHDAKETATRQNHMGMLPEIEELLEEIKKKD
jgi:predicted Zn-dependent protease